MRSPALSEGTVSCEEDAQGRMGPAPFCDVMLFLDFGKDAASGQGGSRRNAAIRDIQNTIGF